MIVDRHRAHHILTGTITQTRLPYKPPTATYSQRLPKTGSHMAIRRDTAFGDIAGHVLITGCHLAPTHHDSLTPNALEQLGHPDIVSYVATWLIDRDTTYIARRAPHGCYATTVDAALAAIETGDSQIVAELADRWYTRWADQPAWIVTFEPAHDRPLYLAGPPAIKYTSRLDGTQVIDDGIRDEDRGYYGTGVREVPDATDLADRGYTTSIHGSLISAGDVFDLATLRGHWSEDARRRHTRARHHLTKPPGNRNAA